MAATQARSDEAEAVRAFMAARAAPPGSDSDEDLAEALEEARLSRQERRAQDRVDGQAVSKLIADAETAASRGQHMDAVARWSEAIALQPHNCELLAARASVCAKLDLHKACLHDGELMVQLLPDWHQGHSVCGCALFCLKQCV